MRILFAVKSCMKSWMAGEHEAIREGWGKHLPQNCDLRFFIGNGSGWLLNTDRDEVKLSVKDKYEDLPEKVRAIMRWALEKGYDYAYLLDNDTFIHPQRIVNLLVGRHQDYIGKFYWEGKDPTEYRGDYRFAFGGFGYYVSRPAMQLVVEALPAKITEEDQWVGSILYKSNAIKIHETNLERFGHYRTWHYPKDSYAGFPKYSAKTGWQKAMAQYHLRDESPDWELFGTYEPDVRMFPVDVIDARGKVPITTIWDRIAALKQNPGSRENDRLIIAYAALQEIQDKNLDAVTVVEWRAAAQCYRDLGMVKEQLGCSIVGCQDSSLPIRVMLAQAYDFAKQYDTALQIIRPLYFAHKDNAALELLHARLSRLAMK
jgi:Galactosyltransferase